MALFIIVSVTNPVVFCCRFGQSELEYRVQFSPMFPFRYSVSATNRQLLYGGPMVIGQSGEKTNTIGFQLRRSTVMATRVSSSSLRDDRSAGQSRLVLRLKRVCAPLSGARRYNDIKYKDVSLTRTVSKRYTRAAVLCITRDRQRARDGERILARNNNNNNDNDDNVYSNVVHADFYARGPLPSLFHVRRTKTRRQ